jgi:hypothetical protein
VDNNEISKLDRFYDDGNGLIIINKKQKPKRKHDINKIVENK